MTEDSRRVRPGCVFAAVCGVHSDGHAYAEAAVRAGAVAILGDRNDLDEIAGVPYLGVPHTRTAVGTLAHALAGNPTQAIKVIGVTGTNGKSSTVTLVSHVLETCGHKTACLGTLGYSFAGETLAAAHTTPFGEDLADVFRRAKAAGCTHAVMEASSHSLEQERVAGIEFFAGAFTNLTQDHLDYHADMDDYRNAKLKLFERITGDGCFTVVNVEDPSAKAFIAASRVPCHTYGKGGAVCARDVVYTVNRTRFVASTPWGEAPVEMRLLGAHNVSNALCAIALCGGLGIPLERIVGAVNTLSCVPGRFEHVDAGQSFQVIVDYAHTDDGLKNVLQAARVICKGRIITVFGCGGDRDKTKRPKMAAVVAGMSDFAIITSDNPRTEDPHRILMDIEVGMQRAGRKRGDEYLVMEDRAQAIREALQKAKSGDLVMIAGKGHEDYQIIGTEKIHFDDRETARMILEEMHKK